MATALQIDQQDALTLYFQINGILLQRMLDGGAADLKGLLRHMIPWLLHQQARVALRQGTQE